MERTGKREMVEKEQPGEIVLVVEAEEDFKNEERRGFEDYTEQPVLSPTIEEAALAPIRAEEKGKRRVEAKENYNTEMLSLLKEMREELKQRDEQLKEELRWRDTHIEEKLKNKEDNLTATLQQRDIKWREELAERDRTLRTEFREREKAFITEQLKRD